MVDFVLGAGGVVYGCVLNGNFHAVYQRVASEPDAVKLRGSKYVQAATNGIYQSVKDDLKAGKLVLFLGTPCYVEGLLSFLHGAYRKNLLTVDIICHGVPSPKLWRDFLTYSQEKEGETITKVNFRDKQHYGWHSHVESVWFGDRRRSSTIYTTIFYSHTALRHSCLACPFTSTDRHSDMTISDCWGLERNMPAFDDNCGTSLVLINTETGRRWFGKIGEAADIVPVVLQDYMQPQLQHPSTCPEEKRKKFWQDYKEQGYRYIFREYGHDSLYWHLRKRVASIRGVHRIVRVIRKFF